MFMWMTNWFVISEMNNVIIILQTEHIPGSLKSYLLDYIQSHGKLLL